ncbi:hypothetical protein [Psychrobacter sp. Marseille-P5312]|uniref:hypothetical protein n=1 Tax=Psychrobacter sp. Marseille-P5312 TaxID=2086574 RepID=UPI000CF623B3|nr:hypothetical protein [Psychrobacter sp. Marseille-P5312]
MNRVGFGQSSFALKALGFTSKVNPDDAILALFTGGKQGVWYDPSDKSTLFQDVAGTVPVTADGDPVALMLDKSGNNNHATQTVSTSRPVYMTDGELHWLEFDGVDDSLSIPDYDIPDKDNYILALTIRSVSSSIGAHERIYYYNNSNVGNIQVNINNSHKLSFTHGDSIYVPNASTRDAVKDKDLVVVTTATKLFVNGEQAVAPDMGAPTPVGEGHFLATRADKEVYYKGRIYSLIASTPNTVDDRTTVDITNYLMINAGIVT